MARSGNAKKPNQGRRNERERNRVNQLNENLEILRNHVPIAKATKKLNKAQTLREAAKYIEHLQAMLNANYTDQQGQNYASCDQQNSMPHAGFAYSDFDIYFPSQQSSQMSMSMEHSPTSSHSSVNMGPGTMSPNSAHQMNCQALSPVSEPAMYHQHYQMQHYQVMHHSP